MNSPSETEKGLNFEVPPGEPAKRLFPWTDEYGPDRGFRPGTKIHPAPIQFIFTGSGMGDYLNYSAACIWVAENAPWVHGTIYVSDFLVELLGLIMKPYRNWQVQSGAKVTLEPDLCICGPDLMINGQKFNHQLLNPTGAHLMDIGFAYYAGMNKAPDGWTLPLVTFEEHKVPQALRGKEGTYVVFTPGAVTAARTTTGKHLNPLIHFVRDELKLTPVFLGKAEFAEGMKVKFDAGIDFAAGLDLRGKTSVAQAGAIMERSAATLGLDNGLLHLAACTSAPLIFGYNITSVAHRQPRRKAGRTVDVALTREELSCTACQSNMKQLVNHSFHNCLYSDLKCVDLLFADGGEKWKQALKQLI